MTNFIESYEKYKERKKIKLPTPTDLRKLRKRAKITQKKLAIKFNVSQSIISRMERAITDPSYSLFKKIYDFLKQLEKY